METFNPIENMEQLTVNHINHIKDDNRLENLEWLSNADNVKEAYSAGLYKNHVGGNNSIPVLCIETNIIYASSASAARAIGIKSKGKVGEAAKISGKKCGGYHWRFLTEEEKAKYFSKKS